MIDFIIPDFVGVVLGVMILQVINIYRAWREFNETDHEVEEFVDLLKDESAPITDMRRDMFDHLLGDDVVRAMESLNEEFRTILILSDLEEMTYEEIAEILEIPLGTVRSRLHRARKVMQEKLYNFAVHHGYITKKTAAEFKSGKLKTDIALAIV